MMIPSARNLWRSISADRKGGNVLRDLIKTADILMENFTPRVMRGWGLDYPEVVKLKAAIVALAPINDA
jgi:crotonobetainyl-CoA:carnitine CoA-transferase CaiB-like acyl-CoA transferase